MNLTTLANVRGWVNSSTTTDDALLTRLIGVASREILNYLQRPELGLQTITETLSGQGTSMVQLRNFPVIAVNSLVIDTVTIPPRPNAAGYGYFLEPVVGGLAGRPQNLYVSGAFAFGGGAGYAVGYNSNGMAAFAGGGGGGRAFPRGAGNIAVGYTFGYCVQNEAQTIPGGAYQVTPNAPYGAYSGDNGVSYASGGALTPVASAPATGQYVPPNLSGDSPTLYYQFAAGDSGKSILVNYNFVPYDIEQSCVETVGEAYRYKTRIGQKSQSMSAQSSTSYDNTRLTKAIRDMLNPYRIVYGG